MTAEGALDFVQVKNYLDFFTLNASSLGRKFSPCDMWEYGSCKLKHQICEVRLQNYDLFKFMYPFLSLNCL